MNAETLQLITALHAAPLRYALVLTGGGTSAAGWLLAVPGGSRTILDVAVPYSEAALAGYLGQKPASFCSLETSRLMARRAFDLAAWLAPGQPAAGVACTASLRSDRPKRGEHRFHVTVQTGSSIWSWSLTLAKDARTRAAEDDVAARAILNAMAEAAGIADRVAVPLLAGEQLRVIGEGQSDVLGRFLAGELDALCQTLDGQCTTAAPRPEVLLPGAFNPLHDGHCRLAAVAAEIEQKPVAFELTVANADKPPLAAAEVRRRLPQFVWRAPLWLTRAPTFVVKAKLFAGTTFVVGADTAARIVQPRFYHDSEAEMAAALDSLRASSCHFLVAGRVDSAGRFVGLDEIDMPANHRDLFRGIPESKFRMDVSSTALRAAKS